MSAARVELRHVRRTQWRGVSAGVLALLRGPAFFVLALAGSILLLVPLMVLVVAGLGVLAMTRSWFDPTTGFVTILLIWVGEILLVRYGVGASMLGIRRLATLTRRLCGEWIGVPIAEPYAPVPGAGGGALGRERLVAIARDPATWRDLLWIATNATFGWILAMLPFALTSTGLIASGAAIVGWTHLSVVLRSVLVVVGVSLAVLALFSASPLLVAYGGLARSTLGPREDPELARRVRHLAQTRSETIDASAAEIRRIERDLHDGAQARLVAMGMTLGAAEDLLDTDPEATRRLLAEARQSSRTALAELRALVSGIHPPVLADRGLVDAIRALALDSVPRVEVVAEPIARPAAPVESAVYFAVSELLANVSKHAQARQAWVAVRDRQGMLAVSVTDDGQGGADPRRGTGLHGIERRLAAFDGVLAISSPPGGPTIVQLEVPCEFSSPKTSSY
ncbi:MAG TPA: histidine kinase [Acidimicrobiales bacterium]|nr:histidine kinase [Acidimicrobiales bacterium]